MRWIFDIIELVQLVNKVWFGEKTGGAHILCAFLVEQQLELQSNFFFLPETLAHFSDLHINHFSFTEQENPELRVSR